MNKSQAVVQFFALLSVLKYKKVVMFYLIPGHSHMIADRVVAWYKNKIRLKNLYVPSQIVEEVNNINSVETRCVGVGGEASFLRSGWAGFLNTHFSALPPGYTGNCMFEIDSGVVTMRHLTTTHDAECVTASLMPDGWTAGQLRGRIASELFGSTDPKQWTIESVTLPMAAPKKVAEKKLASLKSKYFAIPERKAVLRLRLLSPPPSRRRPREIRLKAWCRRSARRSTTPRLLQVVGVFCTS